MSKKQSITIVICVVILVILGILGYRALESRHKKDLDAALEQEKTQWQGKNEELTDKIDSLKRTISTLTGDADLIEDEDINSDDEAMSKTPGEEPEDIESIEEVERRIASFFVHLDQQNYIKKYGFAGSSYNEYEEIIQKISEKTPLLGNETESLYNMFLNIAHFYRVLGSEKLSLIKDVLTYENENIESTMRYFYLWYTYDGKDRKRIKGRPSQQILYEYAGFFLNTIGG
ncbi:MAG: hypothetical protein PVG39_03155, partial [Desulfobacteraceae bacterium]